MSQIHVKKLSASKTLVINPKNSAWIITNNFKEKVSLPSWFYCDIVDLVPVSPVIIVVDVTDSCNLSCKYCYKEGFGKRSMDLDLIKDSILLANSLSRKRNVTIQFHGGEPLLCWDKIEKAILWSKKNNMKVNFKIQTNGTLINSKIARFMNENHICVGISLDGPEKTHNKFRSSFEKTMNGIKTLRDQNVNFGILTVLGKHNFNEIDKFFMFLNKNHLFDIAFTPLTPSGRAKNKKYHLNGREYEDTMKNVFNTMFAYFKKGVLFYERETYLNITYLNTNLRYYMCNEFPCGAGRAMLAIGTNGVVYPCDKMIGNSKFKISNIDKVLSLRQEDIYKYLTNKINEILNYILPFDCNTCTWKTVCNGGCLMDRFSLTGNFQTKHLYCKAFRNLYTNYIARTYNDPKARKFVKHIVKHEIYRVHAKKSTI